MNDAVCDSLECHFDTAFAAPDGIKKLRELILTLAMQGKLVAQDPNDPPASQLLKEIETEKKRLVKECKIKAPKPLPEIKPEEVPYALPQRWEWVRLGEISEINGGFAFKSSHYVDDGVRVVRISDFDEQGFKNDKIVRYSYSKELKSYQLEADNILMAMTGGTVGKSLLVKELPEPMVVNQRVASIKINSRIVPEYVNRVIQTNLIQQVIQNAKNSTNDNISMADINNFYVPLSPLPEQHRIVAKIDQLMARCDELEWLRDEREQKRRSVHTAALKQLLDAQAGNNFADVWRFITLHFGELYAVRENVTELRKAILQLAVMGKLVPQNPNDPPASQLLTEIEAEKKRLVKEGKIKAPKPLPEIKPEEVPYALPQGWEWVRMGMLVTIQTGKKDVNEGHEDGLYPFFSCAAAPLKSNNYSFDCDALLLPGNGANVGQVTRYKGKFEAYQRTYILSDFSCDIAGYLEKTLNARFLKSIEGKQYGSAINYIKIGNLTDFLVPLPPLPEQHRIVSKIDSLMALCDALENQIDAANDKQAALLDAVMAQV